MGVLASLAAAAAAVWIAVFTLPDENLHVVFCDVGQGDAILVTYQTTQLLIDGGPDDRVLGCLGGHMPFYDRRLEAVLLTHPQADHLTGLIDVFKRYTVLAFVRPEVENDTSGYRRLVEAAGQVPVAYPTTGQVVKVGDKIALQIVWPPAGWQSEELNTHSLVGKLSWGDFDVLLTGDADSQVNLAQSATGLLSQVEVLKVPHHGSETAMTDEWLAQVSPSIAVISVGFNNHYGHPRPGTLAQLERVGAKVLRTDTDGEIEIVSDGQKWWYKVDKQ